MNLGREPKQEKLQRYKQWSSQVDALASRNDMGRDDILALLDQFNELTKLLSWAEAQDFIEMLKLEIYDDS